MLIFEIFFVVVTNRLLEILNMSFLYELREKMDFGINAYCIKHGFVIADIVRITEKNRNVYQVVNHKGDHLQAITTNDKDYYVGDFVSVTTVDNQLFITHCLTRENVISKARNTTSKDFLFHVEEQILATNVDQLFILIAADQRFTLSKLERYLMVFSGMVKDIKILISKNDYQLKTEKILEDVSRVYPHLRICSYSILNEESLLHLNTLFEPGETALLVGSSGVGKSTLTNYLLNKVSIITNDVRMDGKGKHTTTATKMYHATSSESYLIDSPGFKGIQTSREIDTQILFEDISRLAVECKFNDCKHQSEPGCAVKSAIKNQRLDSEMYARFLYQKKKREGYERYIRDKNRKKG